MAVYSSGSRQLDWREVEGGELPSARAGLRATLVDDILFLTGGLDVIKFYSYISGGLHDGKDLSSVLSWDPVAECWQAVGELARARDHHAAVAVPASTIAVYCKNSK